MYASYGDARRSGSTHTLPPTQRTAPSHTGSAAPSPASDEGALHLARFLAVCVSVHADALECAVDETANALSQMASEEGAMQDWESELRELTRRAERLRTMRAAIAHARHVREYDHDTDSHTARTSSLSRPPPSCAASSSPSVTQRSSQHRPRPSLLTARQTMSAQAVARLARQAMVCESDDADSAAARTLDQRTPASLRPVSSIHDEAVEEGAAEWARVQSRISRLHAAISHMEQEGMKAKLRRLEAAKARVRSSTSASASTSTSPERLVGAFRFASRVEQLWGSGGVRGSQPSLPSSTRQSAIGEASESAMCSEAEVSRIMAQSCGRLVRRYRHALEAMAQTEWNEHSDATRVYTAMLYAHAMEDSFRQRRPNEEVCEDDEGGGGVYADVGEAGFVHEMQQRRLDSVEGQTRAMAEVLAQYQCGAGEVGEVTASRVGHGAAATVLSEYDFCALPADWAGARALTRIDPRILLPPARHLLTARFSFADVTELKQLQRRRVDVQRRLVHAALDWERVYDGMACLERPRRWPSDRVAPIRRGLGNESTTSPVAPDEAVAGLRRAVHALAAEDALYGYTPSRRVRCGKPVRADEPESAAAGCIPSRRCHGWLTVMREEEGAS